MVAVPKMKNTKQHERRPEYAYNAEAIPLALVYPNTYAVGMGNLGFQFLYDHINSRSLFRAERFFSEAAPNAAKTEPRSFESGKRLSEFPVIAFSVPFENDYPRIPQILLASGISPLRDERSSGHLVIGGGVSVSMNPEPVSDFFDAIHIGEVPDDFNKDFTILDAAHSYLQAKEFSKEAFLQTVRNIPGVYLPQAYSFVFDAQNTIVEIRSAPGFPEKVRAIKRREKESSVPVSVFFAPEAEFGEAFLVETNRGCSRGCRFCSAGWIHFPVRYAESSRFLNCIDEALKQDRTVGLIGSDLAGHPELIDMLEYIIKRGGTFSLSSIRPEALDEKTIALIAATGQKTATLAPETASDRMKRVIGKKIESERFQELIAKLVTAGIPNVRLYFMIGLPTETDHDIEEIIGFVDQCRNVFLSASRPRGKIGSLSIQVNPFVPKPWTPFQWAAMADSKVLERRIKLLKSGIKQPNVQLRVESPKHSIVQGLFSRADRRLSERLIEWALNPGLRPKPSRRDSETMIFRERGSTEIFPWDIVDHGVAKETLRKIYETSTAQER
jgi:radical SAM superfamily enzyme YgiQ (UPF0313 family)